VQLEKETTKRKTEEKRRFDDACGLAHALELLGERWAMLTAYDQYSAEIFDEAGIPVLLVGDAAHATSPNMAEGAAMALEDAIVLAESLGSAADVAAGLALFEQRRRPRTDWVREQTHRRDHARGLPPVVRNLVLRRLGRRIFLGNYEPLREPA